MAEAKKVPAKKTAAKKTATKTAVKKSAAKKAPAKKVAATHEEISRLAHQYYLERGGHHGSDEDDWMRAEKELLSR
jgi:Protein of unknown function (DUF2934)